MAKRILFVDDEPSIRLTLPAVLVSHGFDVRTAATVGEALALIQAERFDVLLTDLNIGEPADGFTLVSAMRRVQPAAITLILTGYPAFETALRAIREQVDDYIVKPAGVLELLSCIEQKLSQPKSKLKSRLVQKRVAALLRDSKGAVIEAWLQAVKLRPELAALPLADKDRIGNLDSLLDEIITRLGKQREQVSAEELRAAAAHGRQRRRQGYSVPMVVEEARLLRHVLQHFLQQQLLEVDLSYWIEDTTRMNDSLDRQLHEALAAYIGDRKPQKEGVA